MTDNDDDDLDTTIDRQTFADLLADLRVGRMFTHATLGGTPEWWLDTAERAVVRLYWYTTDGTARSDVRRWLERRRKGYDWIDLDNASERIAARVAAMLDEIADVAYGWPGEEQCGLTFDEWQADLRWIALRLRRYATMLRCDCGMTGEEYDYHRALTVAEMGWVAEEARAAWARYAEVFEGARS